MFCLERVVSYRDVHSFPTRRSSDLIRRIGASCDWSRERFTFDAGLSRAVREVFVRLYDEGLIYRGKRLINRSEELTSELQSLTNLVCRLLLEKKNKTTISIKDHSIS